LGERSSYWRVWVAEAYAPLKHQSGINGLLPTFGGSPPTSEVVRQVEEEEAFRFARALR